MLLKSAFALSVMFLLASMGIVWKAPCATRNEQTHIVVSTTSPKVAISSKATTTAAQKTAKQKPVVKARPRASTSSPSTTAIQTVVSTSTSKVSEAPASPTTQTYGEEIEAAVHAQINIEREKNGLKALSYDARLQTIAREHSDDMIKRNYFSHDNPDGCGMSCRFQNAGYTYSAAGENIYMMYGYSLAAQGAAIKIVQGWMESPGHRANILNSSYLTEGIGIATQGDSVYATENLAKPR